MSKLSYFAVLFVACSILGCSFAQQERSGLVSVTTTPQNEIGSKEQESLLFDFELLEFNSHNGVLSNQEWLVEETGLNEYDIIAENGDIIILTPVSTQLINEDVVVILNSENNGYTSTVADRVGDDIINSYANNNAMANNNVRSIYNDNANGVTVDFDGSNNNTSLIVPSVPIAPNSNGSNGTAQRPITATPTVNTGNSEIENDINSIKNADGNTGSEINNAASETGNTISNGAENIGDIVKDGATGNGTGNDVNNLRNSAGNTGASISEAANGVGNTVTNGAKGVGNTIKDGAKGIGNAFSNAFGN